MDSDQALCPYQHLSSERERKEFSVFFFDFWGFFSSSSSSFNLNAIDSTLSLAGDDNVTTVTHRIGCRLIALNENVARQQTNFGTLVERESAAAKRLQRAKVQILEWRVERNHRSAGDGGDFSRLGLIHIEIGRRNDDRFADLPIDSLFQRDLRRLCVGICT